MTLIVIMLTFFKGELVFFINKTPQGVAVPFVPAEVFVVVSLYGKCAQVSIVEAEASEQSKSNLNCPFSQWKRFNYDSFCVYDLRLEHGTTTFSNDVS